MHRLLASMTAATLLAHASVGCCWHHGHAGTDGGNAAVTTAPVAPCGHSHEHPCGGGDSAPSDPEQAPQGCDEGPCTFVSSDVRPQLRSLLDGFCLPVVDQQRPLLAMQSELSVGGGWMEYARPPLALHLMHQILIV